MSVHYFLDTLWQRHFRRKDNIWSYGPSVPACQLSSHYQFIILPLEVLMGQNDRVVNDAYFLFLTFHTQGFRMNRFWGMKNSHHIQGIVWHNAMAKEDRCFVLHFIKYQENSTKYSCFFSLSNDPAGSLGGSFSSF